MIVLDKALKNTELPDLPIFGYPRKERIARLIDLTSDCSLIGSHTDFHFLHKTHTPLVLRSRCPHEPICQYSVWIHCSGVTMGR